MGIPGVKTDEWRTFRQLPDSDVVYQIEDEMVTSELEGEIEDSGILLDDSEETRAEVMISYEFHLWNSFLCEVGLFRGASRYQLRAIAKTPRLGSWPRKLHCG